MLIQQHQGF